MEIIEQTQDFLAKRKNIIIDLQELLPKIIGDTDQSPVLVGVTRLENELEKYIHSFLIESPTGKEDLFENGPLTTFSAKISIARRLGLINNELQNAIDNMRKIRNLVNRSSKNLVFETDQILLIVKTMHEKYIDNANYREIENNLSVDKQFFLLKQKNETKAKFILILYYLVYTLQTGKLLAQKKQYQAKLILSFP